MKPEGRRRPGFCHSLPPPSSGSSPRPSLCVSSPPIRIPVVLIHGARPKVPKTGWLTESRFLTAVEAGILEPGCQQDWVLGRVRFQVKHGWLLTACSCGRE